MLSGPVPARGEAPEDKTLFPYFFVENVDYEIDSLRRLCTSSADPAFKVKWPASNTFLKFGLYIN